MTRSYYLLIISLCAILLASCSNTRYLAEDESLFLGGKVNIKDDEVDADEKSTLKTDLEGAIRPRPNSNLLGIRFKLFLYNLGGDPKKNSFIRRTFRKLGEEPVLTSSFNRERNRDILNNLMFNKGFFYSEMDIRVETKKQKTKAYFDVITGPQYKIRKTEFVEDSSQASQDIAAAKEETFLKAGAPYNLDLIKGERERIDNVLKEKGYYFFKPDYIIVQVDTTVGNHELDVFVTLKQDEIPEEAYAVYGINNVYIYPNYRLNARPLDTSLSQAVLYDGYYIIDRRKSYKPFVFKQAMQFKPGDTYNRTQQNISLNRLINLGTFKFVKNSFDVVDSSKSLLDAKYYLTPYPKKSLRFETGALTQNDSRAGSKASISWRNRNTFRGAEQLEVKLTGGFEMQYGGGVQQPNTYQLGVEVNESIPRFVVPFVNIKSSSIFTPRTYIKTGYTYETRAGLFSIHSLKGSYGYDWKEDVRKEHQLYPINVNYVRTDTLGNLDGTYLNYGNLIFNGFIIGPTYEYTFNSQLKQSVGSHYYFDGMIDISGALVDIGQRAKYGDKSDQIFGTSLAKYAKLQTDFRYYYDLNKNHQFAARLFLGAGIPYGGSYQLPNIKQFFSGGNSSLRGFASRRQGPGTFNDLSDGKQDYIELLGDMKFEFNVEWRPVIYQFLKGAVFFDAGNVWLYNDNPNFPGGKFTADFYKQLAADMGVGLRLDFSIVLLRLDLGIPVRKPWKVNDGESPWVFNEIDLGSPTWRSQNMILNIGIGYPF